MRFNFLEIKRKKDKNIFLLLLVLILSYTVGLFLIAYVVLSIVYIASRNTSYLSQAFQWAHKVLFKSPVGWYLLFVGIWISLLAWISAGFSLKNVVNLFKGYPPDPNDRYHKRLINIVEEVKIASGIHNIEPVVLPDTDINAFTCEDFSGRIVIGTTEGALAKLSRQELEAVIGHEMGHVMAGDVLTTTMFSAIMSVYAMLKSVGLTLMRGVVVLGDDSYSRRSRENEGRSSTTLFLIGLSIFLISVLWSVMNSLLIMLISRQREYRADALAIKIVRDPVSLARALIKISDNYKSTRLITDQTVGALFISNPFTKEEEKDSLWEELFSTHPPLSKRIEVICNVAGVSPRDLMRQVKEEEKSRVRQKVSVGLSFIDEELEGGIGHTQWMVFREGEWQGPFGIKELLGMQLTPDTFVRPKDSDVYFLIQDNAELFSLLFSPDKLEKGSSGSREETSGDKYKGLCPRCGIALKKADYEGVEVLACPECFGSIVDKSQLKRILLRQEVGFSDEIKQWGDKLLAIKNKGMRVIKPEPSFICPVCGERRPCPTCKPFSRMYKRPFSLNYPIEVDVCGLCGRIWFDKYELEVLQYVFEKTVKETGKSPEEIWNNMSGVPVRWA